MDEKQTPNEKQPDELSRKMSQRQKANPHATLTEMEEAVEAELAKIHKQLVEDIVPEIEATSQKVPDCPQCGQKMVKNGRRQRELKGKRSSSSDSNGVVSNVGQRFFPLDKALGLLRGAYTPQMQEAMTQTTLHYNLTSAMIILLAILSY